MTEKQASFDLPAVITTPSDAKISLVFELLPISLGMDFLSLQLTGYKARMVVSPSAKLGSYSY
jgi:hypothetical protein